MSDYTSWLLRHYAPGATSAADRDSIAAGLAVMTQPGWDWEMFTSQGNDACAAACRTVLASVADIHTNAELAAAVDKQMALIVLAGQREVADTEPATHFTAAANLMALLAGRAADIDRFSFGPLTDAALTSDATIDKRAEALALEALTRAHRSEFLALRETFRDDLLASRHP